MYGRCGTNRMSPPLPSADTAFPYLQQRRRRGSIRLARLSLIWALAAYRCMQSSRKMPSAMSENWQSLQTWPPHIGCTRGGGQGYLPHEVKLQKACPHKVMSTEGPMDGRAVIKGTITAQERIMGPCDGGRAW